LWTPAAQAAQNVHSNEQIVAPPWSPGNSVPQVSHVLFIFSIFAAFSESTC